MADKPSPDNIEDLSPYVLLRNFSKGRVAPAILLALLIHVVIIGGLSTNYIYRTWIDPTADAQDSAAVTADDADATDSGAAQGTADDEANGQAGKSGTDPRATIDATTDAGDKSDTPPVVERVTDAAKPDDIPDEPGGLGISIDDINE